jgi:hypothetical protein
MLRFGGDEFRSGFDRVGEDLLDRFGDFERGRHDSDDLEMLLMGGFSSRAKRGGQEVYRVDRFLRSTQHVYKAEKRRKSHGEGRADSCG